MGGLRRGAHRPRRRRARPRRAPARPPASAGSSRRWASATWWSPSGWRRRRSPTSRSPCRRRCRRRSPASSTSSRSTHRRGSPSTATRRPCRCGPSSRRRWRSPPGGGVASALTVGPVRRPPRCCPTRTVTCAGPARVDGDSTAAPVRVELRPLASSRSTARRSTRSKPFGWATGFEVGRRRRGHPAVPDPARALRRGGAAGHRLAVVAAGARAPPVRSPIPTARGSRTARRPARSRAGRRAVRSSRLAALVILGGVVAGGLVLDAADSTDPAPPPDAVVGRRRDAGRHAPGHALLDLVLRRRHGHRRRLRGPRRAASPTPPTTPRRAVVTVLTGGIAPPPLVARHHPRRLDHHHGAAGRPPPPRPRRSRRPPPRRRAGPQPRRGVALRDLVKAPLAVGDRRGRRRRDRRRAPDHHARGGRRSRDRALQLHGGAVVVVPVGRHRAGRARAARVHEPVPRRRHRHHRLRHRRGHPADAPLPELRGARSQRGGRVRRRGRHPQGPGVGAGGGRAAGAWWSIGSRPSTAPTRRCEGITLGLGAPVPAEVWVFPAGVIGEGATEQVVVFNPTDEVAEVEVEVRLDDPETNGVPEPFEATVAPHRYSIVDLHEPDLEVTETTPRRIPDDVNHSIIVRSLNGVAGDRREGPHPLGAADERRRRRHARARRSPRRPGCCAAGGVERGAQRDTSPCSTRAPTRTARFSIDALDDGRDARDREPPGPRDPARRATGSIRMRDHIEPRGAAARHHRRRPGRRRARAVPSRRSRHLAVDGHPRRGGHRRLRPARQAEPHACRDGGRRPAPAAVPARAACPGPRTTWPTGDRRPAGSRRSSTRSSPTRSATAPPTPSSSSRAAGCCWSATAARCRTSTVRPSRWCRTPRCCRGRWRSRCSTPPWACWWGRDGFGSTSRPGSPAGTTIGRPSPSITCCRCATGCAGWRTTWTTACRT